MSSDEGTPVMPSIPPDFYVALGKIASGWAYFEQYVNRTIWELANVQQRAGACITAQIISPSARMRCLVALFEFRGADSAAMRKLNKMCHRVDAVARERNRYAHDPLFLRPKDETMHQFTVTADRTLVFDMVKVTMQDLDDFLQKLKSLMMDCHRLFRSIFVELLPYDRRQFERSDGVRIHPIG